ncbi:hypothetical protein F4825DRAFT_58701 [Nemania diffusa]|nr:hypothetical protein F4825DRAFT_58701 [Nemania diffusa]
MEWGMGGVWLCFVLCSVCRGNFIVTARRLEFEAWYHHHHHVWLEKSLRIAGFFACPNGGPVIDRSFEQFHSGLITMLSLKRIPTLGEMFARCDPFGVVAVGVG